MWSIFIERKGAVRDKREVRDIIVNIGAMIIAEEKRKMNEIKNNRGCLYKDFIVYNISCVESILLRGSRIFWIEHNLDSSWYSNSRHSNI